VNNMANTKMPSDNIAISVRNLSKSYRLFKHPGDRIKQFFSLGIRQYHREFSAMEDVSFDICKGETVGIIGRNGSGKSTLLQLICGILKPSSGSVLVNGRVSALLELGAGFNPEFTGRENVYFHGALMGFDKTQMNERFDEIAAFADIGEFIDQPVRTYSSGMFVRLAFSAAISVDPDILVIDEALAVGDAKFQGRCFDRISAIRNRGGTILVVTHALEQVAHFCDRAILINRGNILAFGDTTSTLSHYLEISNTSPRKARQAKATQGDIDDPFRSHPSYCLEENRWGDGAAAITEVLISQDGRENPETIAPGRVVEFTLKINFQSYVKQPIYGMAIKSPVGALVLNINSRDLLGLDTTPDQCAGSTVLISFFIEPFLDCGTYFLSFGVVSESNSGLVPHDRRYDAISLLVSHPHSATGDVTLNPRFRLTNAQ
jgi:lipopolysaccharide transport system ATP-binding protein